MSDATKESLKKLKDLETKILLFFECTICCNKISTSNQFVFCPSLHKICQNCFITYNETLSNSSRSDNNKKDRCMYCKLKINKDLIQRGSPDYTDLFLCLSEKVELEKELELTINEKIEKKFSKKISDHENKITRLQAIIEKKNSIIRKLRPKKETNHEKLKRLIRKYRKNYVSKHSSCPPSTDPRVKTPVKNAKKRNIGQWPTVSEFFEIKRKKNCPSTSPSSVQNHSPAIRPSNLNLSPLSTIPAPVSPLSPNIFNPPSPPPPPPTPVKRNKVLTPRRLFEIQYQSDDAEDDVVVIDRPDISRQSETSATATISSASSFAISGVSLAPELRGNRFEDLVELTFGWRAGAGGGSSRTSTVTSPSLRRPISSIATLPPTAPSSSSLLPVTSGASSSSFPPVSGLLDSELTAASTSTAVDSGLRLSSSGEVVNDVSSVSVLPRPEVPSTLAESDPRRCR